MTNLDIEFDRYNNDVLEWHNIANIPVNNENVHRYINSPELIQSEILETLKAYEEKNVPEFMDGLLDILWEVLFVNEYFKNFNRYMTYCGAENSLSHHSLRNIYSTLSTRDLAFAKVNACEVLERKAYELLMKHFSEKEIIKSLQEVTRANYSKFVPLGTDLDGEVIQNTFKKEEEFILNSGKAEVVNYSLEPMGTEGDVVMVFFNETGKLMKPSTFKGPDHSHLNNKKVL